MKFKFIILVCFVILLGLIFDSNYFKFSLDFNPQKIRVVDGDSINIGSSRYRLFGIDAPEIKQTCNTKKVDEVYECGKLAKEFLQSLIGDNKIRCKHKAIDRYDRFISICKVGKNSLNRLMVRNGWAIAYRRYSKDYIDEENFAKENNLGLWRGEFLQPQEWRKKFK